MDTTHKTPTGVVNAEAVVSVFGFRPSFHDAEVYCATLNRGTGDKGPSITFVVHACASDGSVGKKGCYRVVTSALITLTCRDVSVSELRDLNQQNVLSSLVFDSTAGGNVRVILEPCFGLSGSLVCSQVEVESVVPWRSPSDDAPSVKQA